MYLPLVGELVNSKLKSQGSLTPGAYNLVSNMIKYTYDSYWR
jgi:hypothetical protein